MFFSDYFNQFAGVTFGDIVRVGNGAHAHLHFTIATAYGDHIARLNRMRRFRRPIVEQHKARVTEFLSNCATRAETA